MAPLYANLHSYIGQFQYVQCDIYTISLARSFSIARWHLFFCTICFVRCLSMRHTCCWLVKHLNKHMQLAMHAAHLHVLIKFHQSFWKECLARNNPLLNESKSIWKKRESGHRIGIAKFLTVHTGYIDKNKKISFSNILHISQRYAWQATIIFIYSIIDCLCVFVEFCRNSVSTSFKIKPSLTAIFSIRMIYF